jgi:hypothetical protein
LRAKHLVFLLFGETVNYRSIVAALAAGIMLAGSTSTTAGSGLVNGSSQIPPLSKAPGIAPNRQSGLVVQPKHLILKLPSRVVVYVSGSGVKLFSDGCSGLVANIKARPNENGPKGDAYSVRAIATGKCKAFFKGDDSSTGILTVKVK